MNGNFLKTAVENVRLVQRDSLDRQVAPSSRSLMGLIGDLLCAVTELAEELEKRSNNGTK